MGLVVTTFKDKSMSGELDFPKENIELPLLPLRDVVVFPHMVIPLFVGRPKSIKALETAMEAGKSILLVAQKSAAKDEPSAEERTIGSGNRREAGPRTDRFAAGVFVETAANYRETSRNQKCCANPLQAACDDQFVSAGSETANC